MTAPKFFKKLYALLKSYFKYAGYDLLWYDVIHIFKRFPLSLSPFPVPLRAAFYPEARGSRLPRKRRYSVNQTAHHYIPDERNTDTKFRENLKSQTSYKGNSQLYTCVCTLCRSQWSRGLRRTSAATSVLRLWVRNSLGQRMFVCCEFCALSGRRLCYELITRPEEFYRLRRCVRSRKLVNEEDLARVGPQHQRGKNLFVIDLVQLNHTTFLQ